MLVIQLIFLENQILPTIFYDLFVVDGDDRFMGTVPLSSVISTVRNKKILK